MLICHHTGIISHGPITINAVNLYLSRDTMLMACAWCYAGNIGVNRGSNTESVSPNILSTRPTNQMEYLQLAASHSLTFTLCASNFTIFHKSTVVLVSLLYFAFEPCTFSGDLPLREAMDMIRNTWSVKTASLWDVKHILQTSE